MQAHNPCAATVSESFTTYRNSESILDIPERAVQNIRINSSQIYSKFSINASILKELVDDVLYSGCSKKESNNTCFSLWITDSL